jgi:hypothetical protein
VSTATPAVLGVVQGPQATGRPVQPKHHKYWLTAGVIVAWLVCLGSAGSGIFLILKAVRENKTAVEENRKQGKNKPDNGAGGGWLMLGILLLLLSAFLAVFAGVLTGETIKRY